MVNSKECTNLSGYLQKHKRHSANEQINISLIDIPLTAQKQKQKKANLGKEDIVEASYKNNSTVV